MFLRTYAPKIDAASGMIAGFNFKAVDFEQNCTVLCVGTITEGGGSDPHYYDIVAVVFEGQSFLFKVESTFCRQVGEIRGAKMVSADIMFFDRDPAEIHPDQHRFSLDKSLVSSNAEIAYAFRNDQQRDQILKLLKDGVRRLNFSFDKDPGFMDKPARLFAEFRVHGMPDLPAEPDLSNSIDMPSQIRAAKFLAKEGYAGTVSKFMVANEEKLLADSKKRWWRVTEEAEAWLKENDQQIFAKSVMEILMDDRNAEKLTDFEWVLAQLIRIEPTIVSESRQPHQITTEYLEHMISDIQIQDIFRKIYQLKYRSFVPSFETFLTKIILLLARSYSFRRHHIIQAGAEEYTKKRVKEAEKQFRVIARGIREDHTVLGKMRRLWRNSRRRLLRARHWVLARRISAL